MATRIQVSRGDLVGKQKSGKPLVPAELFFQARTSDENNKDDIYTRWDEGTLYVGRPSLNLDKPNEKPIPIAGARTYFSVVSRGYITNQSSIADPLFKHAMVGDLYIWNNDATEGYFKNVDDFRKDDLLLILDIGENNTSAETGEIINQSLIKYKRINSSGGYADDVYFTQDGKEDGNHWTDFDATNVQDALLELNWEKGQYCGTISVNSQIPSYPKVVIGGVYLITSDQLTFNSGTDLQFSPDKGDFVYWRQNVNTDPSTGYWVHIPSGYTNADEIDYYDHDDDKEYFISQLFSTFNEQHKELFKQSSDNVKDMLDFLMGQKAQLDEQGKIPLSQMHDTVLGGIQFRGVWNPLKDGIIIEDNLDIIDGKQYVKSDKINDIVNSLPGLKSYSQGDTTGLSYGDINDGDYYVVQCEDDILNLQYQFFGVNFELNTGDWIVFSSSSALDDISSGVTGKTGFWSKIDNTDRLSAMQFKLDVNNKNNFFVTHAVDETILTLVGTPRIIGQNKIGIESLGNNTVAITGEGLIDQREYENPLPNFLVRYDNSIGTVKTSFIEEVGGEYDNLPQNERTDHIKDVVTDNKTIVHSNLQIGDVNEVRHQKIFGDITLTPHITQTLDKTNWDKSIVKFEVDVTNNEGNLERRTIGLVPPSGLSAANGYGVNEDIPDSEVSLILPEHTSTLIGKLAGVEFKETRLLKSTSEGYAESTSIEEHINDDECDENNHDSIHNVVEFHSQVSAPVQNAFEYYFGDWNTTEQGPYYDDADIDDSGKLARKWGSQFFSARLVKNTHQISSNITVMLPTQSGTLITEEFINNLMDYDDDTYLAMFGVTKTLDTGAKVNVLQKSPLREVQNALRSRLLASKVVREEDDAKKELQRIIAEATADTFAPTKGDGTFKSTTDVEVADTVIENDLIAGVFNDDGTIKEKKSIVATRAIGVSDPDYGTGLIQGARQNFPDAEQYYDPVTGLPTIPSDVVVDMPNESGVMLTSNSVISGGVWN